MKKQLTTLLFLLLAQSLTCFAGDLIAEIQYGDSQDTVTQKLSKSNLVKTELDKSMFARVGINGSFQTTNTLQGMPFKLYFDWDRIGSTSALNQITYRSSPISPTESNSLLKPAWISAQNLLTSMFGKPANAGEFPQIANLSESSIQYSHEWKTKEGFIYLGIGKENAKLNLSIGFHKNPLGGQ